MDEADLIEELKERIIYQWEGWLFSGNEHHPKIDEFVKWCIEDLTNQLYVPRGPDSKSFYMRREEKRKTPVSTGANINHDTQCLEH